MKIIQKIISSVIGKKKSQKFFETLHRFSVAGMNIGVCSNPEESGEKFALRYVCDNLRTLDHVTIFDVGANIGAYSSLVKNVFGSRAAIHAFEPSLRTFQKLLESVRGQQGIAPHNFGLGDRNTKSVLYSNTERSGLASLSKRRLDHFGLALNESELVEIKTIDSFCQEMKIDRIHFLKLDIEGHEIGALEGAEEMLSRGKIDFVQFEFGGCNIDSRTFFQDFWYLLHSQFLIYRVLKDGLFPINQYEETREIFLTTNFLAEKR